MNKKYLSVVLFGALLAASAGTFTSCKDYDDDIKGLQEQIDKSGSTITDLQTQLTTLKAAAEAAQATADAAKAAAVEAKTAADAAKAAGDQAKADAADALAKAKAAEAAAATAKTEAIAEATKLVEALRNSMQEAIDKKLDTADFEAASKLLGARIDGIEAGLSALENGAVKENTEAIKNAMDLIETLQTADENFATTLKELDEYVKITLEAKIDANAEDIKAAQDDIKAAQDDLAALWKEIDGKGGLKDLIGANKTAISDLETKIAEDLDLIKKDVKDLQTAIKKINDQLTDINKNLTGLHTLVTCRLTSISLAPDLFVDGIEAVRFNSLKYSPMDVKDENAGIPDVSYKFSTAALATASYHFNPASFKLANADYGYIDRTAEVINTTRAIAASKLVEIVGTPIADPVTGTVDFKLLRLNAHSTQPELDQTNLIALQAILKGDAVDKEEANVAITSPYVSIYDNVLDANDVRIADEATLVEFGKTAHYATTFDACTKEDPRYEIPYDQVLNLKELVATCFGDRTEINIHREFPIEDYKLSYRFAVASSAYNIKDNDTETNQQKWIKCNDAIAGTFQAEGFNPEAFGRTPILKVELVDEAGNVVRRGFVKVKFIADKVLDFTVGNEAKDLTIACNDTKASYSITEEFIRENVYRKITNSTNIGMSHEEFWNIYTTATYEVKKNNKVFGMATPKIVDGTTEVGTATKKIVWEFTHEELGKIGAGGSQFVATVTVKNKLTSSKYPDKITFKFTVNVKLPVKTLKATINEQYWQTVNGEFAFFKVNAANPHAVDSPATECLIDQNLTLAYNSDYAVTGLPNCVEKEYRVIETYSNGKKTTLPLAGVKIDGNMISLDKKDNKVKEALNSANGLQATVAHVYTLNSGDEITVNTFMVNFIRPVSLNMPSGIEVQDAKTGGDVANFQWDGMLMDWRGAAIVSPSSKQYDKIDSFWKKACMPEYEMTEGYYKEITPASLNVTTGTVDIVTANAITMYEGKATYTYASVDPDGTAMEKTFTTHAMVTEAEVNADLEKQALAAIETGYHTPVVGTIIYKNVEVTAGSSIKYTYIASIDYVPAVVEWVPGEYVVKPHVCDLEPTFEGTSYGQRVGCWEWTSTKTPLWSWNPGQYWFFYGAEINDPMTEFGGIGEVVADVNGATTNLTYNGNKLPANATLVQDGNTVRYDNVKSPIEYSYEIYIPVSVNYGWGTLNTRLTIKVNPVK